MTGALCVDAEPRDVCPTPLRADRTGARSMIGFELTIEPMRLVRSLGVERLGLVLVTKEVLQEGPGHNAVSRSKLVPMSTSGDLAGNVESGFGL